MTRRRGQGSPPESTAARTRSRASRHDSIGQPDEREPGQPVGDVDLDRNGAPDRAAQGGGGDHGEHARGTVAAVAWLERTASDAGPI